MNGGKGYLLRGGRHDGVPGYFLSARIGDADGALGVAVVKVDMEPLERAWGFAGEMTGLADDAGSFSDRYRGMEISPPLYSGRATAR